MEKFPMVEMDSGYTGRYGIELRVHADLSASFGYYGAYSHDGVGMRSEQHMPATVDADQAPRYVIAIEYYGGPEYAGAEELPGVAAGRIDGARPDLLRTRPTPQAAEDTAVLDCELSGDSLDCTFTGREEPQIWKFTRKAEET
jgi:hypothetical protein